MRAFLLLGLAALAASQRNTYDCPMRQVGVNFAQKLQPFRSLASFQAVADALNTAPEAQQCNVTPTAYEQQPVPRRVSVNAAAEWYVDPNVGSDSNPGTISAPVKTIAKGVELSNSVSGPRTVFLRAGTYYQSSTIVLTTQNNDLTISAYNGEEAIVSGAIPFTPTWKPYNITKPVWNVYQDTNLVSPPGQPVPGQVVIYGKVASWEDCQAACQANTSFGGCTDWTWHDPNVNGFALECWFRYDGVFHPDSQVDHVSGNVDPGLYIYVTDMSATGITAVPGLRLNGGRLIRARYPNADPEKGFQSNLEATSWLAPTTPKNPDVEINPATPYRNTSTEFQQYALGIGGPCETFSPPAGYWCSNATSGGGAFTYRIPSGITASTAVLPHQPYKHPEGGIIQAKHPGQWASWMFEIGSGAPNGNGVYQYTFSKGGFQGARGANSGGVFYVENIFEELDAVNEWFYDPSTQLLYLAFNSSSPATAGYSVPNLKVLFNITGSQSAPVQGITIAGLTLRDTALTYMDPHGMPSGGDWAFERTAAIYIEGTENTVIEDNLFIRLDGNAVLLSAYNRGAVVQRNEFGYIGDSAIAQWGNTVGVEEVPGMGWDGTTGDQPRGTQVLYNLIYEVGVWEKQSSFYVQFKTAQATLLGNIMYNGPRAAVNFNDGFGGGANVTYNIMFNVVRETSDHGTFNSWDRQVYVTDVLNGQPSFIKAFDDISHNFIISNYGAAEAIDNDDGSCYYRTHSNFLSYSGNGMKSDFGGHDGIAFGNVYAFVGGGFTMYNTQLPGHEDQFYGNTLVLSDDGSVGHNQACGSDIQPITHDNTMYSPTGNITECGMPLSKWQSQGHDPGSTASAYPPNMNELILAAGSALLGL